jgi:hypothetical protein
MSLRFWSLVKAVEVEEEPPQVVEVEVPSSNDPTMESLREAIPDLQRELPLLLM